MEKEKKKITQEEIKAIEEKAKKIRKGIIEEVYSHQSGHPGGSLSVADIMAVLYFKETRRSDRSFAWKNNKKSRYSGSNTVVYNRLGCSIYGG